MKGWTPEQMAARAAEEVAAGLQVSLGAGLPTMVANYLPAGVDVVHVAAHPGKDVPSSATSSVLPGGVDVAIVEAIQVSARGELVGTPVAGGEPTTVVHAAKRVIVLMEHVAEDGSFNVVQECSLQHVGPGPVQRIITDLAVIDVLSSSDGAGAATRLRLVETAPGVSDGWVRRWTGALL
jgi:3-oxoacid CoA-transferase subunit B